jgi:hypothetical protein
MAHIKKLRGLDTVGATMILPGETKAGSAGDTTMPRVSLVG